MDDEWILLPEAVEVVRTAIGLDDITARGMLFDWLSTAAVGSRIGVEVNGNYGQPDRNKPMLGTYWTDLENLHGNWWTTGNAEWDDNYAWRGIQIHAGDLRINIGPKGKQTRVELQPVAPSSSTDEFQEAPRDWLELWQGPLNFRATYDKGSFGPGHSIERINQYGKEGATGGGRHEPIYNVRLDPNDGAVVIEWLIGLPGQPPPFQTSRHYNGGPGRISYDRVREDPVARELAFRHLPPEHRDRAVGAYACANSIRGWAESEFFNAIHAEYCEVWARVGSRVAPFRRIPADIFRSYEIRSWGYGKPGGAWADLEGAEPLFSIRVAASASYEGPIQPVIEEQRFTYEEVVSWSREWLDGGRGNGMDKAWLAFKKLSRAKGCARDTVFRPAWNEAKTKSN